MGRWRVRWEGCKDFGKRLPRRGFREAGAVRKTEGGNGLRGGEARRTSAEGVVPVAERRCKKLDDGVKSNHGLSHGLAGRVEIKAAAQAAALLKEVWQPGRIEIGRASCRERVCMLV